MDVTAAAVVGVAAANAVTVAVWAHGHGATGVEGHSILVLTNALDVCEIDPATSTARGSARRVEQGPGDRRGPDTRWGVRRRAAGAQRTVSP
ncbi:hypothetical protein [Gordonia sp. N1V]|uniref:hypothetical protein n=1 Tax=Gordonia sp. N1V TaxID=3034163 RepID=UPI0023E274F3|nr:hypothetical protein [Gordonia sp. N1V]MDF3285445.1 hypothetical protein [Gordonia sp. N1V]